MVNISRRNLQITFNFLLRFVFIHILLSGPDLKAQFCDKKFAVHFEKNQFSIYKDESRRFEKFCKVFENKTDTFMVEIYAYSDSIASDEYNYKLANRRLMSIRSYLKKNTSAHLYINGKVRGETQPLSSNATEKGRANNRRAEIFYWKLSDEKLTLRAKRGTEIDLDRNYFSDCGVCESNPNVSEIFTNEEAVRQGISLTTTEGEQLITGGMLNLELNCVETTKKAGRKKWPCTDVIVRIPAPDYDPEMQIWKVTKESTPGNLRWERDEKGDLTYDAKNKCYLMKVNYCPGLGNFRSGLNCDKVGAPPSNESLKTTTVSDSVGLIAVPELIRSKRTTNVKMENSGTIYGNHIVSDNMWGFRYNRAKGNVIFVDSGIAKNKVGYQFSGIINSYKAQCDSTKCRTEKECWCFEIPIDHYKKIIYFKKNKSYRLKVPLKYRKYSVRLFLPAADTLVDVAKINGRKYLFEEPLPETHIVLYRQIDEVNNKRAFDRPVFLGDIPIKYKKRKGYYKATVKRRMLKK